MKPKQIIYTFLLSTFFWLVIAGATVVGAEAELTNWVVLSPKKTVQVTVKQKANGALSYRVDRLTNGRFIEAVGWSSLGLELSWVDRQSPRKLVKADFQSTISFQHLAERVIDDQYEMLTGKRRQNHYQANEMRLNFRDNETDKALRVDIQAAEDGFAIRYVLPDQSPLSYWVTKEDTSFNIGLGGQFWGQPYDVASLWTPAYETPYVNGVPIGSVVEEGTGSGWGFP